MFQITSTDYRWSRRTDVHSLKNTFVAVVLLGVSYFVYDGITKPDQPLNAAPGEGIDLEIPDVEQLAEMAKETGANYGAKIGDLIRPISEKVSELKVPNLGDFSDRPSSFNPRSNLSGGQTTPPPTRNRGFKAPPLTASTTPTAPPRVQPKLTAPSFPTPNTGNQFRPRADFQSNPTTSAPIPRPETKSNPDFIAQSELTAVAPRAFPAEQAFLPTSPYNPENEIQQTGNFVATQPAPAATAPVMTPADLNSAWPKVDELVKQGRYRSALETLSPFYNLNGISDAESANLLEWLDGLAGKVIYSSEHNLARIAYVVQPNDSLQSIAEQWNVPPQLIYNINQEKIANPLTLMPGNELKVVQGPFHAQLDTRSNTLTLFLNNMYAGRFSAKVGTAKPGNYQVRSKTASGDPLGSFLLSLSDPSTGNRSSMHTSSGLQDSIGLSASDAEDLFGILSVGSEVTIK